MTEPLSSDRLERLLPVLSHVAEMVRKQGALGREDLQLLLLAAGLEEGWVLEELERWVRVLVAVRGVSDPIKCELAQRALMLRGIPEAAAMLAVSVAAGGGKEEAPLPSRRLRASVERLDLGTLAPGQGAMAEFEVEGGPGQIVAESDQVQVTPQRFGTGTTRVRVDVRPMQSGVLWTTLQLVTAGETLEVPLAAQWVESVQQVEESRNLVADQAGSRERWDAGVSIPWPNLPAQTRHRGHGRRVVIAAVLVAIAITVWGLLRLSGSKGSGIAWPISSLTPTPARFQVACLAQASGLRRTPSGQEIRSLTAGLPVWVQGAIGGMVHIRLPEGEEGYLPQAVLYPSPETDLPVACVRSTLRLRLREGPGTRFPIRELLKPGTPLGVLEGPQEGWLKVRTPSGQVGWVAGEWVSPIALRPTGETISLPAGP